MTRGKAGTRGRSILAGALLLCGQLSADGGPSWSDLSPDERTLLADMLKLDENTWPDAFAERMKLQSFAQGYAAKRKTQVDGLLAALEQASTADEKARALAAMEAAKLDDRSLRLWHPEIDTPIESLAGTKVPKEPPPAIEEQNRAAQSRVSKDQNRYAGEAGAAHFAEDADLTARRTPTPSAPPPPRAASDTPELLRPSQEASLGGAVWDGFRFWRESRPAEAGKRAQELNDAGTVEGRRILDETPGLGQPGAIDLEYGPLPDGLVAKTGKGFPTPIYFNSEYKGSPAEKYYLQHEFDHVRAESLGNYGQMAMEESAHLSAIRSFVEDHPEFTQGLDKLKVDKLDRPTVFLYLQARLWADHLSDSDRSRLDTLENECQTQYHAGRLAKQTCTNMKSTVDGDQRCSVGAMCGGYGALFPFIDATYSGSGETRSEDQATVGFLRQEINRDLDARKRLGYNLTVP